MAGKKNRKKDAKASPVVGIGILAVVGLVAVSLSYLWLYRQCNQLGVRIKQLEQEKAELHKRVKNEEYKWSNLKSPRNIELLMERFQLAMIRPDEKQVVRLRFEAAPVMAQASGASRNPGLAHD